MKLRRDTVTGIVGLAACAFFAWGAQLIKMPKKLLEPGPRLLPYVAIALVGISSIALIIKGIKERNKEEKPYFPKGGVRKITISFLILCAYAAALNFFGFLPSTPFATFVLIYDLRGQSKVKPIPVAIISIVLTAALYAMFVYGFQVKLPVGVFFE